jgi:hypothetical protein
MRRAPPKMVARALDFTGPRARCTFKRIKYPFVVSLLRTFLFRCHIDVERTSGTLVLVGVSHNAAIGYKVHFAGGRQLLRPILLLVVVGRAFARAIRYTIDSLYKFRH